MTLLTIVPLLLSLASSASNSTPRPQDAVIIQASPTQDAALRLVMYDVADVLDLIHPPGITLNEEYKGEAAEKLREGERAKRSAAMYSLQHAVQQHLFPAWDRNRNVAQPVGETVLAVSAVNDQHLWIEAFLENLRSEGVGQVLITTTFLEVPRGTLKSLNIESPIARLEDDAALEIALDGIQLSPGCTKISTPRMICKDFGRASMCVQNEIAYVKEWEVKLIEPEKQLIADPVVDTVREGYELSALAVPLPGKRYGMELKFVRTTIARPIPTKKIAIATDPVKEVSISLPEVTRVSLETSLIFEEGSSAVFATPANDEVHDLVVIVTLGEMLLRPVPPKPAKKAEMRLKR